MYLSTVMFQDRVTTDGQWIGELDLLTTCIHYLELHFTDRWHRPVSSVYYSLH
jgi:hypothetical protein